MAKVGGQNGPQPATIRRLCRPMLITAKANHGQGKSQRQRDDPLRHTDTDPCSQIYSSVSYSRDFPRSSSFMFSRTMASAHTCRLLQKPLSQPYPTHPEDWIEHGDSYCLFLGNQAMDQP